MKYVILSIDDSREHYKKNIREVVDCEEIQIQTVNGHTANLEKELIDRNLKNTNVWTPFKRGEIGVWLSTFDAWVWSSICNENLIVFEDDAVPAPDFMAQLADLDIPEDFGYVSLWVPPNQLQDYSYSLTYDEWGTPTIYGSLPPGMSRFNLIPNHPRMCGVYQGYGNVANIYSPAGARALLLQVAKTGLYTPIDCFTHATAHIKKVNGLAPKPQFATLVDYEWPETTVHNGEIFT